MPVDPVGAQSLLRAFEVGYAVQKAKLDREQRQQQFQMQIQQRREQFEQAHQLNMEKFQALTDIRKGQEKLKKASAIQSFITAMSDMYSQGLLDDEKGYAAANAVGLQLDLSQEDLTPIIQSMRNLQQLGTVQRGEYAKWTPEIARREGAIAGARAKAVHDYRMAELMVKDWNRTRLQMWVTNANNNNRTEIAKMRELALYNRQKLANKGMLAAAEIRAGGSKENIQDAIELAKWGGFASETSIPAKIRTQVLAGVRKGGDGVLYRSDYEDFYKIGSNLRTFLDMYQGLIVERKDDFAPEDQSEFAQALRNMKGEIKTAMATGKWGVVTARMQTFLGNLVHSVGGESASRLSDDDIKRMMNSLPKEGFTYQQAVDAFNNLRYVINDSLNNAFKQRHLSINQKRQILMEMENPHLFPRLLGIPMEGMQEGEFTDEEYNARFGGQQ